MKHFIASNIKIHYKLSPKVNIVMEFNVVYQQFRAMYGGVKSAVTGPDSSQFF